MSRRDLTAKAWNIDHDITLMERVLGRPELVDRLILYVRHAEGFLCTWPVGDGAEAEADELVAAIAVARARKIQRLHIWGPAVAGVEAVGLRMWYVVPVRDFDRLMRVDLNTAALGLTARRGSKGRGRFRVTTVAGFPGASLMGRLVEPYLNRNEIPPLQKSLIGLAHNADLHEGCVSHVGLNDYGPAGVIVAYPLKTGVVVVRWALFDRQAGRVSDFLFWQVGRYYRQHGIMFLDLGYGGSSTLFAYKRKLGAESLGQPILRWGVFVT